MPLDKARQVATRDQEQAERARRSPGEVVQRAVAPLRPRDGTPHRRRPHGRLEDDARGEGLDLRARLSSELEGHVEEVWGWEAYDDLLLDFVRRLKAFQTDGIVPGGTFCLPYVRSDEIILLIDSEGGGVAEGPWLWARRRRSSTS
jgi:hypothetical protein